MLFFLIGIAAVAGIDAMFAPWAFFLGGRVHLLPVWQGVGRMHATSGDYVVYFWMSPAPGGRTLNLPYFTGRAYLCTPRGERIQLRMTGGLNEHTGIDTNNKEMHVTLYRRPWYFRWTGVWDERPRLELRGRWQNPRLVMDDGGSLSRAFLPDGTLYQGPARNQPAMREKLSLVLHETGWSGWFSDCRATEE